MIPRELEQRPTLVTDSTMASFSVGSLSVRAGGPFGCGANRGIASTTRISPANSVFVGGLRAGDGGVDAWIGPEQPGGTNADACLMRWAGQPIAPSPGSTPIDSAWAADKNPAGTYTLYVVEAGAAGPVVAHSTDSGGTYPAVALAGKLAPGARPWVAAQGAATSLVSFSDQILPGRVSVLRSNDGGATYSPTGPILAGGDRRGANHRLGNLVIDHRNAPGPATGDFWAYQAFLAPASETGRDVNHAFVAVSKDGGRSWTTHGVGCSTSNRSLVGEVPSISVAPDGSLWYAWSDGATVHAAVSHDHGSAWRCSASLSPGFLAARLPSLVATSAGIDLTFYGSHSKDEWSLYLSQNLSAKTEGWLVAQELTAVHQGASENLVPAALDVDQLGWLHLSYALDGIEQDIPAMEVGYAVQTGGTQVGFPN